MLPSGTIGEDQNGNQIVGRTWVTRTDAWSSSKPSEFLIQGNESVRIGPDPGVIYLMRSPSNDVDIYKIGLTQRTPEERSRELSGTGTALPFEVLANWTVGNCAKVEAEVHRRLSAFRLNPRREFFRADLGVIIETIQEVVRSPGIDDG